jgi:hypothetical protein
LGPDVRRLTKRQRFGGSKRENVDADFFDQRILSR